MVPVSLSQEGRSYSAHGEQLDMLRFQGKADCAYTIRTNCNDPGHWHLKSWLVETSAEGESSQEVAQEKDNEKLNGKWFTGTFAVAGCEDCRFIRLVNIGRNHYRDDSLTITAWEIFGSLFE
jgi:hypothetical protein